MGTEKKTEIDSPSKTTFNMKCLLVLLLSVMTVVMGSAEPIYSDGYPCLCYDNLLGGDTYQVRRWPATYVAEPKGPLQRDANNNAYFSSPDLLDHLDLKDHQDLLVLLERLVRLERQGRNVRYSSGVNFVKLIEMKIFVLRYH